MVYEPRFAYTSFEIPLTFRTQPMRLAGRSSRYERETPHFFRSNRSRSMTLAQAAVKSFTNFSLESALA